jgi:hypothetical protein
MNLLENCIEKIYSEKDVTEEFDKKISQRRDPNEKVFLLDMEVNCYGRKERVERYFYEGDLKEAKAKGYYMA